MFLDAKNSLYVIILLSSVLLLITACGIMLVRKFREYRSLPYLLASFIFLIQVYGIISILLSSVFGNRISAPFEIVLPPEKLVSGFVPEFCILAYLIEIKTPGKLNWKNFLLFLSPVAVISVLLFASPVTILQSVAEIPANICRTDILLRLVLVLLLCAYPIIVACTPYEWRKCLVSRRTVVFFQVLFCICPPMCVAGLLCGYFPAILLNFGILMVIDIHVVYIELKVRIPEVESKMPPESVPEAESPSTAKLSVKTILDSDEIWMNPDMTATELARIMGTNRTYLQNRIKELGYSSYPDMVNRKRVDYICKCLEKNPERSIVQLMFEAGFRSRSAAGSEFKRIKGCTPSEYQETIK